MKQTKALRLPLLTGIFACCLLASVRAQTPLPDFQGVITYLPMSDDYAESDTRTTPDRIIVSSGSHGVRYEEVLGEDRRVVLTFPEREVQYVLFTFLGKRLALISPITDNPAIGALDVTTSDALPIAGSPAERITTNGETIIYSTKHRLNAAQLPTAPGLVLEFNYQNTGMRFQASQIDEQIPDDALFKIPADYQITSLEELQQIFGLQED